MVSLKRAISPVRPRLRTRKHRRHTQKRTAFCRRVPPRPPRIRQTKRAPPPINVWKIRHDCMPHATTRPLSAYSSTSPICTSLPQSSPQTEATKVDDAEALDEDNSLPPLQSSSSSQALTCSSPQSSSRTEVIKVGDGEDLHKDNSLPTLESSSGSQAILKPVRTPVAILGSLGVCIYVPASRHWPISYSPIRLI